MVDKRDIGILFDSIIEDKTEKKIMELIVNGKNSDEIIEELIRSAAGGVDTD